MGTVAEPERIRGVQSELDLVSANKWVLEAVIAGGNPNDLSVYAIDLNGLHSVYVGLDDL